MNGQHQTGHPRVGRCSRAWGFVVLIVLLMSGCSLLVAGCGSSGDPAVTASTAPQATGSTTTAAASSADATTFSNTVTGTTSDQQGNRAMVTVGVGTAQPLAKLTDPTPTACNQAIGNDGLSVSDAVAIPLHVTATLTSSLKAPFDVDLSEVAYIDPQSHAIQPLTNDTNLSELWASSYTNSEPQCPTISEVKWAAEVVTPNAAATWEPWLVIVGAITPDDPSGEAITDGILIRPGAGVGSSYGNGDLTPQGSGWVHCSVDESIAGPHSEPYIALDPATAEANGCSASG